VLVLTLDSIGLYEEGSTHVGHFYVYSLALINASQVAPPLPSPSGR
jgi:hypothetical protein